MSHTLSMMEYEIIRVTYELLTTEIRKALVREGVIFNDIP